jgi:hypothetical protein
MANVKQLKALRAFVVQLAIPFKGMSLGDLNLLRYEKVGRSPTAEEWGMLEDCTQRMYQYLSEPLRRKFLYSQIPMWVTLTAGILGAVAVVALFGAFVSVVDQSKGPLIVFLCFLAWVAALGAMGSIAFIGMNALSVQDDATFDLTNSKLLILRIALGALFGLVLTLPFGFHGFARFCLELADTKAPTSAESGLAIQSVKLLLPFILGFSTTLVIMILNQFVEAIQSFFGKKSSPAVVQAPVQNAASSSGPGGTV